MGSPKTTKKKTDKPETEPAAPPADVEVTATYLTSGQRAFLQRLSRFLVNIQSPRYNGRALKNGYTPEVHAEGWKLWAGACGMNRPLEHWFSEQQQVGLQSDLAGEQLRLLKDLDDFENLWFPRVKMVIRRCVPRASRDVFAEAFFANLQQQPLGPGVVGSVRTLLQRIAQLETSTQPGAKKVYTTLVERGLTVARRAEVEGQLKTVESSLGQSSKPSGVDPEELANAQAAQLEAYEDLKDWFSDWSTMLRTAFNVRERLNLGLAVQAKRGSKEEIVEDEDEIEELEGAEEAEKVAPK